MDERLRFVARLLDGEKMTALCREFDVSRTTGYKIYQRYKDCGLDGLTDRSRRPSDTPTGCHSRLRRRSFSSSGNDRIDLVAAVAGAGFDPATFGL